jgi:hypothetical protein
MRQAAPAAAAPRGRPAPFCALLAGSRASSSTTLGHTQPHSTRLASPRARPLQVPQPDLSLGLPSRELSRRLYMGYSDQMNLAGRNSNRMLMDPGGSLDPGRLRMTPSLETHLAARSLLLEGGLHPCRTPTHPSTTALLPGRRPGVLPPRGHLPRWHLQAQPACLPPGGAGRVSALQRESSAGCRARQPGLAACAAAGALAWPGLAGVPRRQVPACP